MPITFEECCLRDDLCPLLNQLPGAYRCSFSIQRLINLDNLETLLPEVIQECALVSKASFPQHSGSGIPIPWRGQLPQGNRVIESGKMKTGKMV